VSEYSRCLQQTLCLHCFLHLPARANAIEIRCEIFVLGNVDFVHVPPVQDREQVGVRNRKILPGQVFFTGEFLIEIGELLGQISLHDRFVGVRCGGLNSGEKPLCSSVAI